jgi:hypothetical protein
MATGKVKRAKGALQGSGGKFSWRRGKRLRPGFSILVDLAVPADPGKHDGSQVGFEQSVRLGEGVVEPGAFFEFIPIHTRLSEHFLGGFAALGAHRIKFKNNSGRPANRQFDVLLRSSHADRVALRALPRYVTKS